MSKCPITYENCEGKYSKNGLKILSRNLVELKDLNYSADEQRLEAAKRATKMSIQGVQPKLSAILNIKQSKFEIVDIKGKYILKPQHHIYPQLPENEDLTMKMASKCGIDTPIHGMVYSKDGTLTYFIKRYDRVGKNSKLHVEDFAQLAGQMRDTKYNYTIEKLIKLIDDYCTFPQIEKIKFFKRFLFNFLIGNEDMHLKNYSIISQNDKIELCPAYDFLNSSIVLGKDIEETALSIKGKKKSLNKSILIDYLGEERLNLNQTVINKTLKELQNAIPLWFDLINNSFLRKDLIEDYTELLDKRIQLLEL
ncbi:MAG TPA: HipA domain-containing protein [Tenuifilaceae bacterium]|nr:HipA domain-containing protein [Tenuifilaceae bacterium]HPE18822.1 HipA domain-containing protein [Tenuifilaceae bacterium]HPJ46292.1 HipA domain-containing protein [Tenuifilaceae bacterium]HPQ34666.1 HipA domain-containing protein [Tenuifilaceae bacterium]HRX68086.1 HipA domain-containing protein [Tenuifilaceae bacterium]